MATQQDTVIPRRQDGGLLKYRVTPTGSDTLPPVTFIVDDGPFHFQDQLDPKEARGLADMLYKVADEYQPVKRPTGPICKACGGHGEIIANPSPDQDPQSEERAVCYPCGGTGTPLVRR